VSFFNFCSRLPFIFRQTPVAFTGKRKPYCHFRYPKTQQDRRQAFGLAADAGELPVQLEKLRYRKGLPTAYDDLGRTFQRSWKEHRKTQWK
jgi:hypothetical protein